MSVVPQWARRGHQIPGTTVRGSCEVLDVGVLGTEQGPLQVGRLRGFLSTSISMLLTYVTLFNGSSIQNILTVIQSIRLYFSLKEDLHIQ